LVLIAEEDVLEEPSLADLPEVGVHRPGQDSRLVEPVMFGEPEPAVELHLLVERLGRILTRTNLRLAVRAIPTVKVR